MRLLTLLLAAALLLVVAAPAQADDESVFRAWTRENSTLAKLEIGLDKNLRSWSNSGLKKGAPALERISKIRALVARRRAAVIEEDPSTGDGGSGKKNALAAMRDYNSAMLKLRSAINAGMDGNSSSARSYLRQYDALIQRSQKYERRAEAAFERAGVA